MSFFLNFLKNERLGQFAMQDLQACKRVSLKPILDNLRACFAATNNEFGRVCSLTKGYFTFRHWYAHGRTRAMPVVPDPDDVTSYTVNSRTTCSTDKKSLRGQCALATDACFSRAPVSAPARR